MAESREPSDPNQSVKDKKIPENSSSIVTKQTSKSDLNIDPNNFNKLVAFFNSTKTTDDQSTLQSSNLVILACKYNNVDILECVFENIDFLGIFRSETLMRPDETDDESHNAFYYAIRSENRKLIETLVKKWPRDNCKVSDQDIYNLLANSYEELNLKNVTLLYETVAYVESLLIDYRFYSEDSESRSPAVETMHHDIEERINLVIENIELLIREYSSTKENERFFYISRFIAQNINILKRSLRSTYNKLPWEEMEFCLIAFNSHNCIYKTHAKTIYNFFLTKEKLFRYLDTFRLTLENEKANIDFMKLRELSILPSIRREINVSDIINSNPDWKDLYADYQDLRDTYSLEIINKYFNLASLTNSTCREGQLLIMRALQVMGKYLKNTLESPKMSRVIGDFLMSSLSPSTQQLVISMQNSLSHNFSQSLSLLINYSDLTFFLNIQKEIKVLYNTINIMLHKTRFQHITNIFQKITKCETIDEIKNVLKITYKLDMKYWTVVYNEKRDEEISKLIEELRSIISYEGCDSFYPYSKIKKIIVDEIKNKSHKVDYVTKLSKLIQFRQQLNKKYFDSNRMKDIKNYAQYFLTAISGLEDRQDVRKIKLYASFLASHMDPNISLHERKHVADLVKKIVYKIGFDSQGLDWLEEIGGRLHQNNESCTEEKEKGKWKWKGKGKGKGKSRKQTYDRADKLNEEYNIKISTLKKILDENDLVRFTSYKDDKMLQSTVEMLVLDLISILNDSRMDFLCDDQLFLDRYSPILIGKNLRNYLAHDNDIIGILEFDPTVAVFLNAKKFTAENVIASNKKIGKVSTSDLNDLKIKYEYELKTIAIQEEMFSALEQGNLEKVKETLKKGADLKGKDCNSWTALHFAAKAPSLEVVNFVISQTVYLYNKNSSFQTALHIAAAYGRLSTVELFIKKKFDVDSLDISNQSPLHAAAECGHEKVVRVLLKNKANTSIRDMHGYTALHQAVLNDNKRVVEILLKCEQNADTNLSIDGSSALQLAVKSGYTDLVNYLLDNGAGINFINDKKETALSLAAKNGYFNILQILISRYANIHAVDIHGCTTLHYAVENHQIEIVKLLLEHKASVNSRNQYTNHTPIIFAAEEGDVDILKLLLKYKAKVNVSTSDGMTPLHYAAYLGCMDMVEVLINNEAKIDVKSKDGLTPLHLACSKNSPRVVEFLISKGASTSIQDLNKVLPLHTAAYYGRTECIKVLLQNGISVNLKDGNGKTALHYSSQNGHIETVEFLLSEGIKVNAMSLKRLSALDEASYTGQAEVIKKLVEAGARDSDNCFALQRAVFEDYPEIVEYLIRSNASIVPDSIYQTLIQMAVEQDTPDIAKILLENSDHIDIDPFTLQVREAFKISVSKNYMDIVKLLLNCGVQVKTEENGHIFVAVLYGYKDMVDLLLSHTNIDINLKYTKDMTLLHHAVLSNSLKIIEFLLEKGANINAMSELGTPICLAAKKGLIGVVKFLLSRGADINLRQSKEFNVIEAATFHGHVELVEFLIDQEKIDINEKRDDDSTLVFLATQGGHLPLIEMLVRMGTDINARSKSGLKPIHYAAYLGYNDIIEYYLNKNIDLYDRGSDGQTILHYAVKENKKDTVEYLINKKMDVNITNLHGQTPLQIAVNHGFQIIVEILLKNNAAYDSAVIRNANPNVARLLDNIHKLFQAVKENSIAQVKRCIKQNVNLNSCNSDKMTPLHFVAKKGHTDIAELLLSNKANPNIANNNGITPIHYAAEFGYLKILKLLLINGAIYNPKTKENITPLDLAKESRVIELLKFIDGLFVNIKNHNLQLIYDLHGKKSEDLKLITHIRNEDNSSVLVHAVKNKYPQAELLEYILHEHLGSSSVITKKRLLFKKFDEAQKAFKSIVKKNKKVLKAEDSSIFDEEFNSASIAYHQQKYSEASVKCRQIIDKKTNTSKADDRKKLKTTCLLAMTEFRLGNIDESLKLFEETYEKQKKILDDVDDDLLTTQIQMSLSLMNLKRYEEALSYSNDALQKLKKKRNKDDPNILVVKSNIGKIYNRQGKYEEALNLFDEIYETRKRVLGENHSSTLKAISHKCDVLVAQKKFNEALPIYKKLLISQTNALEQNHLDTLLTKVAIGNIYFEQNDMLEAYKMYDSVIKPITATLEPTHPCVLAVTAKIETIQNFYKTTGQSKLLDYYKSNLEIGEIAKRKDSIKALLETGSDINTKDTFGLTLLHYAVNNQNLIIVKFLLQNKANCTLVSNEGNTALHFAVSNNNKNLVTTLLEHAKEVLERSQLQDFIDMKITKSGITCLHIAAQNGFEDIVKVLLKYGATYNYKSLVTFKTPLQVCTNENISKLLKLIDELFIDAKNGEEGIVIKLKRFESDKRMSVLNARDLNGKTLAIIALMNNHKSLAQQLLNLLKKTTR